MEVMQFLRVDFKLQEINENLQQEHEFSKGKNRRILVSKTKIVLLLTWYFFHPNSINWIIDSIRIKSRFWILPYFLYTFRYTCSSKSIQYLSLSLLKCLYTIETVLACIRFSVKNFKSTFIMAKSRLRWAINASVMQSAK